MMLQLRVGGERKESVTLKQSRKQTVVVSIRNEYYIMTGIFFSKYSVVRASLSVMWHSCNLHHNTLVGRAPSHNMQALS